jgi:formate dehydrogenase major subunit
MIGRTLNNELRPSDVLDVSLVDADRYGFSNGQMVRVKSRYGSATLPICVNETVKPGELFATFQSPDILLNALMGPNRDQWVGTPEYKLTAVQIEAIGDRAVVTPTAVTAVETGAASVTAR